MRTRLHFAVVFAAAVLSACLTPKPTEPPPQPATTLAPPAVASAQSKPPEASAQNATPAAPRRDDVVQCVADLNAEASPIAAATELHPELARELGELYAKHQSQCDVGGPGGASFVVRVEPNGSVTLVLVGMGDIPNCAALQCVGKTFESLKVRHAPAEPTTVHVELAWSDAKAARYAPDYQYDASAKLRCPIKGPVGHLEPVEIQKVVRENFGPMRECYDKGLATDATLEGKVVMRFAIDREGKVSAVGLGELTLPRCDVARCVRDTFWKLQFPKPEGGIVTVVYPIRFSPE